MQIASSGTSRYSFLKVRQKSCIALFWNTSWRVLSFGSLVTSWTVSERSYLSLMVYLNAALSMFCNTTLIGKKFFFIAKLPGQLDDWGKHSQWLARQICFCQWNHLSMETCQCFCLHLFVSRLKFFFANAVNLLLKSMNIFTLERCITYWFF